MGFVEIKKKGRANRYATDVVYRINQKTKLGAFRFSKKGIETLFNKFPEVDINTPFRVFIDKDNGNLAFKSDAKGDFRIALSKKDQYAIFSTDLTREVEKDSFYLLQHSKDYSFILVAVEDEKTSELPSPKETETTKSTSSQTQDTNEQATNSNDSKTVQTPKLRASKARKAKVETIEAKAETITQTKTQTKAETKVETKAEAKLEPTKPEGVKEEPAKDKVEAKSTKTPKVYKVAPKAENKPTLDKPKAKGLLKKAK